MHSGSSIYFRSGSLLFGRIHCGKRDDAFPGIEDFASEVSPEELFHLLGDPSLPQYFDPNRSAVDLQLSSEWTK